MAMELTPDQKKQLAVIMSLASQGQVGRQYLAALQPFFSMIEENKQRKDNQRAAKKAQQNAILGQLGGIAGNVGGLYLASKILGSGGGGASAVGGSQGLNALANSTQVPSVLGGEGAATAGTADAAVTPLAADTGASTLGSVGAYALPIAAVAATLNNIWETGGKDILRGRGNRADWANQFANMTGIGEIGNIGLRLAGKRSIGEMMTTGKSDAQQIRDDFRGKLKESGIADKDYNVALADGSKFNIGLDGHAQLNNSDGKGTRNTWDVDASNPLAKVAVEKIDPIVRSIYSSGDSKNKIPAEQFTGMLVNAATSNAKNANDVMANLKAMNIDKLGMPNSEAPIKVGASAIPANTPLVPSVSKPSPTAAPTPTPASSGMLSNNFMAQAPTSGSLDVAPKGLMAVPNMLNPTGANSMEDIMALIQSGKFKLQPV